MGSPASEEVTRRRADARVTIAEPFAVGVHEVTFAEWDACVRDGGCGGHRPDDEGWGRGRRPVINVSWDDAQAYVRWLSGETGKEYRLLSESEWEWECAARAETTTPFHYGRTIPRHRRTTMGITHTVREARGSTGRGRYRLGASGRMASACMTCWERVGVEDCWNGSYRGAPSDGSAWERGDCDRRMARGGSWDDKPSYLRSAFRFGLDSVYRLDNLGLRVAGTLTS